MHDFILAKEIIDELKRVGIERKLAKISAVKLEIGIVALAHDGFSEHTEDVSLENLEFGLSNISKGTLAEGAKFQIKRTEGTNWKITEIEGE